MARQNGRNGRARGSSWQAAEIHCDHECACEAVRKLEGQRFLVRDVPSIPLPDCDAPECKCSYERFKDRRMWDGERRAFYSMQTQLYGADGGDNRRKKGRRSSDESIADKDEFESLFDL